MKLNQRRRNLVLLSILVGLITLTTVLIKWDPGVSRTNLDESKFSVGNIADLDRIVIAGKTHNIDLQKQFDNWTLNEQYQADPYMIELLLSLLNRIRVSRPVAKGNVESVMELINTSGGKVQLYQNDVLVKQFMVGGDPDQRFTFFMEEQESKPFLVRIPGYNDYLAPIFNLTTSQWRNRVIFNSSWRSIKRIQVTYTDQPDWDFTIQYRQNFLEIEGLSQLDTAKMMNYLEIFSRFPAEGFIEPAEYPQYQNLIKESRPQLRIELEDINSGRNNLLELYPKLDGDIYYVGLVKGEDMALFDASRIGSLMVSKKDFAGE